MFLLPFIFLFLSACSDNLLHSETKPLYIERIRIEVQSETQNKYPVVLTDYALPYSDTILIGDTISFHAKINPPGAKIKRCYWLIESDDSECWQTAANKHTFKTAGIYPIKLYVLDIFGDTLFVNMSISVSSKPVCSNLSLAYFQGSPIFKWDCQNSDSSSSLTYKFTLKTENKTETIFLKEDFLMLGYSLPSDYWEAHLTAESSYGFKAELDSVFKAEVEEEEED